MTEWKTIDSAPRGGFIKIPLTLGQVSVINKSDLHLVSGYSWHAHPRSDGVGFYAVNSNGKRMHRLIMNVSDGYIVDHRDGDGLNNIRENLRVGTQSQNCVNRRQTPGESLRGVRKKGEKWQAYLKYQGKQKSLGYFNDPESAHKAYISEANKIHGDWMPLPHPPISE